MSGHDNPYAAPRSALEPASAAGPLPEGVRGYRLDPLASAALVRRRLVWCGFGFFIGMLPILPGMLSPSSSRLANSLTVLGIGGLAAVILVRLRHMAKRAVLAFDLLVGPRVVRRVSPGVPPAEVLRPEVTSIVESGAGLWLCSDRPSRALLVPKSLEGYDGLRAELATWAPRRSVGAGWWGSWRLMSQQGLRDEIAGTRLETDASLAHELDAVRRASSEAWTAFPQPKFRRRFLVLLALWVALVVVFLAVLQALQSSLPRRPTGVSLSSAVHADGPARSASSRFIASTLNV